MFVFRVIAREIVAMNQSAIQLAGSSKSIFSAWQALRQSPRTASGQGSKASQQQPPGR